MSPDSAGGGPIDPTTNQNVRHRTRQTLRQDQNDGPTNGTMKLTGAARTQRRAENTRKARKMGKVKTRQWRGRLDGPQFFRRRAGVFRDKNKESLPRASQPSPGEAWV